MTDKSASYDVFVIGGGINGVGIAADAAGRGLRVALCEMNDLASATSSHSSKLIHGGLRYLEYYEFRLVLEALSEREVLLKKAPHIVQPMRFRLPYQPHLRPAFMLRTGLFIYDHLGKRTTLRGSQSIKFGQESVLVPEITKGFEYSDAQADDSRLVIINAMAAEAQGALIMTRTRCINARRTDGHWEIELENTETGERSLIFSKAVVNAAGPWVENIFGQVFNAKCPQATRLVKGSHIIVPKLHNEPEAYIVQNSDNRIVFVIPYETDFSLIGTTDVEIDGDPAQAKISDNEVDYLLDITNDYFNRKITRDDVVHSFCGVRPLLDNNETDAQAVTRDYTFEIQTDRGALPLLSIFGGKLTTYRKLAESALKALKPYFNSMGKNWTRDAILPGGDFESMEALLRQLAEAHSWAPDQLLARLARTYGTKSFVMLAQSKTIDDLGMCFSDDLYKIEVDYVMDCEWAKTVDDVIWRRTKLGLRLTESQKKHLEDYISDRNGRSVIMDKAS